MEQNRLFKDINKNLVTREAEILNKGKFHALNKIIYKLGDLELTYRFSIWKLARET